MSESVVGRDTNSTDDMDTPRSGVSRTSRPLILLVTLMITFIAGADQIPEPPNYDAVDLGPVRDAFREIADDLETALEEAEATIADLEERAENARDDVLEQPLACIATNGLLFLGAFATSFASPPGPDYLPDVASYIFDNALKFCRPHITVKDVPESGFDPAADNGADECLLEVDQVTEEGHTTFLVIPSGGGFILPNEPRLESWGPLGTPESIHVNSDVNVWMTGPYHRPGDSELRYPLGRHVLSWVGITQISPLDLMFLYIPGVPEGAKKSTKVLETLFDIALEVALFELGASESQLEFIDRITTGQNNSASTIVDSELTVLDLVDPEIESSSGSNIIEFEGLEPGGASIKTQRNRLAPMISVSDKCRQPHELEVREPTNFWPVNTVSEAVWTVLDPGPNATGGRNSASTTQFIRVIDTIAPNVLAPPSQVAEVTGAQAGKFVPIGAPRTFDLVDLSPTISKTFIPSGPLPVDGGYEFPIGVTEVQWCAVDSSGNDSCASGVDALATQIINVKAEGANNAPSANAQTGSGAPTAGGFDPVEIIVSGTDPDFDSNSGRFDPLFFEITRAPENGFFVAPLLPYFIDDYRIPFQDSTNRCTPNRAPEVIVEPQNIRVAESGMMYVLTPSLSIDSGCNPADPFFFIPENRISIFDTNGDEQEYVTGRDLPRAADLFGFYYDEARNRIIYTTFGANGTSALLLVLDGDTLETLQSFTFGPTDSVRKAVLDGNGILYTGAGTAKVDVWDARPSTCPDTTCDLSDKRITELNYIPSELTSGGNGVAIDLALSSDDSLMIGTFFHLYQYTPATIDPNGDPVVGELVGFLGACGSGDGCDVLTEATRGFSCTHDTCDALYPPNTQSSGPGQFSSAQSIALDPNDAIYVADRNNRRVQRFTPEGFFAGQARSSCDDADPDRCLQEGFVLANFGRPDTISVNSKHLYVLDENPNLEIVHVFQTSVLTPVSDSEAKIVYQSDTGFSGSDSFEFRVTDGFDVSAPAIVEVAVTAENRTAPRAESLSLNVAEDVTTAITLRGTDDDFGPDVLTYRVVAQPLHGTISGGNGAQRTYTPDANYFGEDAFTYVADDGTFESEPVYAFITVDPIADAPELDMPDAFWAELDEPALLTFSFSDADPNTKHTVEIDWGDGVVEQEGVLNSDGTASGPLLSESDVVTGFVAATHQYSGPAREVQVIACILPADTEDDPSPAEITCDSTVAKVDLDFLFGSGFE